MPDGAPQPAPFAHSVSVTDFEIDPTARLAATIGTDRTVRVWDIDENRQLFSLEHPDAAIAWRAVCKLLIVEPGRAYCQPCLSPIWDTGLAGHAMAEAGEETSAACAWLRERQILDVVGDWSVRRPGLRPGGWAFQYANPHYPDVDDTAVVGMLLHRNGDPAYAEAIERAREWIIGMQSAGGGKLDGGWGAFEPENVHLYLNHIPFADHGALLDPPTSDVTARCVSSLAQIGMAADDPVTVSAVVIAVASTFSKFVTLAVSPAVWSRPAATAKLTAVTVLEAGSTSVSLPSPPSMLSSLP